MNLKKIYLRQQFLPSKIGVFFNSSYIIRRELFKGIKKFSRSIKGRVLDYGCGSKPYRELFNCKEYIGLDIEQSGHDHSNEDIDVFFDGKSIPFEDETFDQVFASEVFEHVFELNKTLKEINRVLKKRGLFLLTTPFVWPEHEKPFDFGRYTSYGLEYALEKNGFRILDSIKTGNSVLTLAQLKIEYISQLIMTKNEYMNSIFKIFFISPLIVFAYLCNFILPKSKDLYLSNIVLAQKK